MKRNVKEIYQDIYNNYIKTYIENVLVEKNLEPIAYTIEGGENRFRSALTYIIGGKYGCKYANVLGATAEIIWASILILDDLGDNAFWRRGRDAVWKRNGILHAEHTLSLAQLLCEELLIKETENPQIVYSFKKALKDTVVSQIEQVYFEIDQISESDLRRNYIKKTSIGRWALSSAACNEKEIAKEIYDLYIELSFAAQIKDDIEDFIKNDDYEKSLEDIKNHIVTYPIWYLYRVANDTQKQEIWSYYHTKNDTYDFILKMMREYDIINKCKEYVNNEIERVVSKISSKIRIEIPEYVEWIMQHKIIL